jgi:hypothetical protein
MINTCGTDDSGKTEFILSCPDPGIILALDRNFDATLKNSNPPAARRQDWGFKVVKAPVATQETQDVYKAYWKNFYAEYQKALSNPDAITVALDGDSDSWELQQLAEFGRTTQIAPWDTRRVGLNAARRAMINRAWDAEKVIIFTNKVTAEYETCYKDDGTPMLTPDGREIQKKTGRMKRQGFQSTNYLWQICLTHIYEPPTEKREKRWGLRIDKCKSDKGLEGMVLWGDDCCFAGLMQTVYPQMPLEHWGL